MRQYYDSLGQWFLTYVSLWPAYAAHKVLPGPQVENHSAHHLTSSHTTPYGQHPPPRDPNIEWGQEWRAGHGAGTLTPDPTVTLDLTGWGRAAARTPDLAGWGRAAPGRQDPAM